MPDDELDVLEEFDVLDELESDDDEVDVDEELFEVDASPLDELSPLGFEDAPLSEAELPLRA